ncbi:LysR family transcriptional regulator [Pseudoalteromonas sp. SCSIO 43201]|uniref:LysR family transcriptional regulator n=1 Tax=Pseudoalteromonas TaxID=53246 RepID=UPI0020753AF7|nr:MULTISPECIES: LysR family transcriptional regulator [Pseudoalteromonas]MDW7551229.1 LysR family transcriptional regulator [Pseudoalteromonas peptidolytica]USD28414.1 LysR family transcriptional regulator [Pseudoalteromonas sp. SCSIO 43201]
MLDDLRLFIEISRWGSFAKAAEELGIGAPTLSKRMLALEDKLGYPLLLRSARGLRLTNHGQAVVDEMADPLLALHAKSETLSTLEAKTFHLLCPQNLIIDPLYDALQSFQSQHPDIQLHVEPANSVALLSQKRFDLAIRVGELEDSSVYQKRLGQITVRVVVAKEIATTQTLFLPFKASQIPATDEWLTLLAQFNHVSYVGDITLVRKLVGSENGAGVLPMTEIAALRAHSKTAFKYIGDCQFTRNIYALWPNQRIPPAHTKDFIEQLQAQCQALDYLQGAVLSLS